MTLDDLKKHCEKTINMCRGTKAGEEHEMVLHLVEKQMPKDPIVKGDEIECYWVCPNCDTTYAADTMIKFCANCGQAIKWD